MPVIRRAEEGVLSSHFRYSTNIPLNYLYTDDIIPLPEDKILHNLKC